jgi:conjugal transfer mating pair stabilization protein TraG
MDWEIYTYGNGEFLRILFNGIAAIMGEGGYANLIQLAGYVALAWIALSSAVSLRPIDFKWLISFIFVYNILFLPKVDVIIIDRIDPSQSSVVGNVPWGLGVFASVISQIGDTLTTWSEAVNTLPDDLRYQSNGVVMASSLVEAATQFEVTDANMQANLSAFFRQCVFYDILLRRYTWNDLLAEPDLWTFLSTNASQARSFEYNGSIVLCRTGASLLDSDWALEVQRAAGIYGVRFNEYLNMVDARAKLLSDLPISYDYLAGISRSGADLIRQNMMMNLFRRSLTQFAGSADATAAAQDFATAQAEASRRAAYTTMGKMAAKLIPVIKNIFEGLLYGSFPFLFLFFLLPIGGKAILLYLQNLVWLQLWAPLFAILNLLMTLYGGDHSTAAVLDGGNNSVLTLQTASGLRQVNSDTAMMAGYLCMSIPLIAYGLVTGGRIALTQLAAQVGAVAQSYSMQAAGQTATGNMNLATMGAYSTSMFQHNTAPSHHSGQATYTDPGTGVSYTTNQSGIYANIPQNQLPITGSVESAVRSGVSHQASQKVEGARSSLTSYGDSAGETYATMNQFVSSLDKSRSTGTDWSHSDLSSYKKEAGEVSQLVENFKTSHDLTNQQKAGLLAGASVALKTPNPGGLSPIEIQGRTSLDLDSKAAYKEVWTQALDYAKRTNFGEHYEQAVDAGQRASANESESSGDRFSEQVSDQLSRELQLREQLSATVTDAASWQRAQSLVTDDAFRVNLEVGSSIRQYMIDQGVLGGTEGVDTIFSRAAAGYAQDQDIITSYAQRYAQERGLELAGVDQSVRDGQQAPLQYGEKQQRSVQMDGYNQAVGMMINTRTQAEVKNLSDNQELEAGFDKTVEQVNTIRENNESHMTSVEKETIAQGVELQVETEDKVEEGGSSAGLIKNAGSSGLNSIANSPGQIIKGLKDMMSGDSNESNDKTE